MIGEAPPSQATQLSCGAGDESNAGGHDKSVARVDIEEARRFLQFLDAEATTWSFRTIEEGGRQARILTGSFDTLAMELQLANGAGHGVFVAVNDGGAKAADIVRIRAVFADFDGAALPAEWDLDPHLVIESSPGNSTCTGSSSGFP